MDKIQQLLDIYNEYNYKLLPSIVPKYFKTFYSNSITNTQFLQKLQSQAPDECECCHAAGELHPSFKFEYSLIEKKAIISSVEFLCTDCYNSISLPQILNVMSGEEEAVEVDQLCRHFLICNEINPDTNNAYDTAQQCYCVAYSLNILLNSFPFNFFLKQFTLPLSDDIPVDEVVNSVLNKSDKLVKQKSKKQRRH